MWQFSITWTSYKFAHHGSDFWANSITEAIAKAIELAPNGWGACGKVKELHLSVRVPEDRLDFKEWTIKIKDGIQTIKRHKDTHSGWHTSDNAGYAPSAVAYAPIPGQSPGTPPN